MLNQFIVIETKGGITMFAEVEETLNIRSGDVDQAMKINFFSGNHANIGYAKVTISGNHQYIKGDYNGKELLNKFQLLA